MKGRIQLSTRLGSMDLKLEAGFSDEIIIVSGENGAGKTTLLRCLAGLENVEGQITFSGKVWLDSSAGFVLPSKNREIGCLWTDTALLPWLGVEKNIILGSAFEDSVWLEELAELLEITDLMQRKPVMLSTGEAQRVALARAIYRKPSALLLDEPFSAQAPAIRQRLRDVLKSIQTRLMIPVLMVSHDLEDAENLADQHWRMREGRLLKEIVDTGKNRMKQA
ncbi:molybdate transport system ATP-binding protein [Mariprofundus micogutta]|uniref:Molybdate transport system ATP-binding protein n=1 Tax=Mariprofundus micogutta TaxID=1921010 RepID=A0A1L8CQC8_9PROT|nr:ATP-binding cassette domain-containing protein [Mariprofundus micogutta]GAV21136.1 molybdate transport system ATP-binding protein [Mariprofundus micogutta]